MYNCEHFIRDNKRGGGASLMINKLIPYTNRVDLVPNNAHYSLKLKSKFLVSIS